MTVTNNKNVPLIVLAEDDEDDQEFIALAFSRVSPNHEFQIKNNGQEVLDYLSSLPDHHLPCLIVLDLNMPVLDGIQTLKALKKDKKYQNIPKVIFTTSDSTEDKKQCLSQGATDYFVKPHNMGEIVKSVQAMLNYCG